MTLDALRRQWRCYFVAGGCLTFGDWLDRYHPAGQS